MIGKVLGGRYELLEEIGKGGMAYVYKARCVLLNRIVAVKILRDDLDGDEEFLLRFNAEAQAAASLGHPNIVSIFDVGEDEGRRYIVMEYVDGNTLKEYIHDKGRLHYKEALNIAAQISDALTAAHAKNIVHRDIKPHNILVTSDGIIKVADFGIARFGTGKTISNGNDILGSVQYISPEQAKGLSVDNRSDIYSLGVVMYEMLTGVLPFNGDNPVSIAMMQIEDAPEEFIQDYPDIPASVQHIVFKAMSKDADLRYQESEYLKDDIVKVLKNPNYIIDTRFLNENFTSDVVDTKKTTVTKSTSKAEPVKKRSTVVLLVICAVITSLLIVSTVCIIANPEFGKSVFGVFSGGSSSQLKAPDLAGKTFDEAKMICDKMGLSIVVSEEKNNTTQEPGTILNQSPKVNTNVKKGDTVRVVLCKNELPFVVGDYIGKNYEDVVEILGDKNITANVVFQKSTEKKNTIIRQNPDKGDTITSDDEIILYVSGGDDLNDDDRIKISSLVGKTYSEARKILESKGLKLGITGANRNPNTDTKVISQEPKKDSVIIKGSTVYLEFEAEKDNTDSNSNKSESVSKDNDTTKPESQKSDDDNTDNTKKNNDGKSGKTDDTNNVDNSSKVEETKNNEGNTSAGNTETSNREETSNE